MRRHIKKVARMFGGRWRSLDPEERRRIFDIGAGLIARWHTDEIQRSLPAWSAIRTWCLGHGLLDELVDIAWTTPEAAFQDPLVEGGRLFARYPHFRDGSGIPDSCFDITRQVVPQHRLASAAVIAGSLELAGQAYLALVGGTTTVELRRWPRGPTWAFETSTVATPELRDLRIAYPSAGYKATVDLRTAAGGEPLPRGTWSIHASIGTAAVRRSVAVTAPRRGGGTAARGATARGAAAVVKGGGLRVTSGRELRLRIGRMTLAERGLERLESVASRASRLGRRLLTSLPIGRLVQRAMARVRPGRTAIPDDDER
jgi:hypothetical protein